MLLAAIIKERIFMKRTFFVQLIFLMAILPGMGFSQTPMADEIVDVDAFAERTSLVANQPTRIALELTIRDGWHIYAPLTEESFTIPTEVSTDSLPGVTLETWEFPTGETLTVAGIDEPALVYSKKITLFNTLTITDPNLEQFTLTGSVSYQPCDDKTCLIPAEIPFKLQMTVVPIGTSTAALHPEIFSAANDIDRINNSAASPGYKASTDDIAGLVESRGLFLTFILIFLGGLALNLTPCVYPLIPITVSFFGGRDVSKGKTFASAVAYVLGIAITYSVLGVIAASTGALFGNLLTNPVVLIGIAVLLVGLSLSMFGVYEFRLPSGLMMAAGQSKSGILGALFMGLTLGIVAAPCVGPFVIGLLTYVAQLQSVVLGFWMFFVLALGLGLPYLFLAMFSSKITNLPRSGAWMIGVRVIFGLILVGMAIYFLLPLLGEAGTWIFGAFIFLSGFYLIVIDKNGAETGGFLALKNMIGIAAIVIATYLLIPQSNAGSAAEISWNHPVTISEFDNLLAQSSMPIMLDFYADWCIPCREMDKFTFTDPRVVKAAANFTRIKIDLTSAEGAMQTTLRERYQIKGVPTYVFMSAKAVEQGSLRLTGFERSNDFLKRLERVTFE